MRINLQQQHFLDLDVRSILFKISIYLNEQKNNENAHINFLSFFLTSPVFCNGLRLLFKYQSIVVVNTIYQNGLC